MCDILTWPKTPCCYFVKCFNTKQNHEKTKYKTRVYILMQVLDLQRILIEKLSHQEMGNMKMGILFQHV